MIGLQHSEIELTRGICLFNKELTMAKNYIIFNNKLYLVSSVVLEGHFHGVLETMIFPVHNGIISGEAVYCFRTFDTEESNATHNDILTNPEQYLSDEAIRKYKTMYYDTSNNETSNTTDSCEHKWVFQETKKKTHVTGYQNKTAHFHRTDVYYCEKCCEIKEIENRGSVNLPFGGIHNVQKYAPDWY